MSGWPLLALGEVFDIARGGSPRPIDDFITEDPAGINWIMIGDASEGSKYITGTKKRIRPEGAQRSRAVKPGDFLLTNSMSFGKPYIMRTSGCIHDGWLVLSPRRGDVDADFFYHLLGSNAVYSEFERRAAGATVKNLNIDLVRGVKIPLPPLPEQRRIAEILDKADALRAKRRAALAQLDTLTQSIFLDMFGDPATNPKGWPVSELGTLLRDVTNGMTRRRPESEVGQSIVLRLRDIREGWIDFSNVNRITLSSTEAEKYEVVPGDLLFIRVNGNPQYVGRCALFAGYPERVYFNDHVMRVRIDAASVDGEFLAFLLNGSHGKREIAKHRKTSAGQHTINQDGLSRIRLPLPPLLLQRQFADRVAAVEAWKRTHDACLQASDQLFASLQHRAFRGEL